MRVVIVFGVFFFKKITEGVVVPRSVCGGVLLVENLLVVLCKFLGRCT